MPKKQHFKGKNSMLYFGIGMHIHASDLSLSQQFCCILATIVYVHYSYENSRGLWTKLWFLGRNNPATNFHRHPVHWPSSPRPPTADEASNHNGHLKYIFSAKFVSMLHLVVTLASWPVKDAKVSFDETFKKMQNSFVFMITSKCHLETPTQNSMTSSLRYF